MKESNKYELKNVKLFEAFINEDNTSEAKQQWKEFSEVKVGDKGEDYSGEVGIVKAKGLLKDMKKWFTRGQVGYTDAIEAGMEPDTECVAVLPEDDEESFDSPKGGTYVFSYGDDGFTAYKK